MLDDGPGILSQSIVFHALDTVDNDLRIYWLFWLIEYQKRRSILLSSVNLESFKAARSFKAANQGT